MHRFFFTLVLSSFLSGLAPAQEAPLVFRDWTYERKDIGLPFGNVCVASTEKKVGEDIWRLSILFSPDTAKPTQVVISSQDATLENSVIYSQTDSSRNVQEHFRSPFLDASLGNKAYWFAPKSFVDFYKYIRRGSSLKVKYTQDTEKQLYFSLMGSTAATNKIAELCNNKKEFVPEAFYNYIDKLDITQLPTTTDSSVATAWDNLTEAWQFYGLSLEHQRHLKEIQSRIDPLLAQQRAFLQQAGLLSQEIEEAEESKAELEEQLVTLRAQLKTRTDELALEDAKLQAALVVLKNKEDAYRPVKDEGRSYFAAVEAAKQRVASLSNQVLNTEASLTQARNRLASLWDDARVLDSHIRSQQQQLSQLRSDRIRANNAYLSFNVEREYQQKLSTDSVYQMRLRNKNQSDNDLVRKQNILSREESKLRDLERQLQQCRAQPNRDCSSLRNQVDRQRNEVSRAERDYNNELTTNRSLTQSLALRRSQLRQMVEDEQVALAQRVRNLDISISDMERSLAYNQSRLNTIRTIDIPRTESDVSSLENSLQLQQSQLSSARDTLRWSEQDLANFKLRTDYDRKEREYFAANNDVQSIRTTMARLDAQIQSLKTSIAKNQVKIESLTARIEKLITDLASTQTELQEIQAALDPLLQEKQLYTIELNRAQASLKENAEAYKVSIRDLPVGKSTRPSFPVKFHHWL